MTILLLIIAWSALGQAIISPDNIISDSVNTSPNRDFENRIGIRPIDLSDFDLEIRFYKLTAATNKRNLRVVRSINGDWEALEFDENKKSGIKEQQIYPTSGFNTFLHNLMKNNLTTLLNQDEVEKVIESSYSSKKDYWQSRPTIMDGYEFTVEFKIRDKFRIYQFANPESYIRHYDNYEEFKNYAGIQRLFEHDLGRK